MGSNLQKWGLGAALVLMFGVSLYYGYMAGNFNRFLLNNKVVGPTFRLGATTTPTASAGVPTPAPKISTTGSTLLAAVNKQRTSSALKPLTASAVLQAIAQAYAQDMAKRGFFDHTNPEGATFQDRLVAGGYKGNAAAENLALTSGTLISVVGDWMKSPPHKANILGAYTTVGFGSATGTRSGAAVTYVVAIFGDR